MQRLACILVALMGPGAEPTAHVKSFEGAAPTSAPSLVQPQQRALCGVTALYTASKLLQRPVQYHDLLRSEFVGSPAGSSIAALQHACEHLGLHELALEGLTIRDLSRIQHPVILHVESMPGSGRFDHFILFAGMRDGKAIIFDAPHPKRLMALGELAPIWSGNALLVANRSIGNLAIAVPAWFDAARTVLVALLLVALLHVVWRRFNSVGSERRPKLRLMFQALTVFGLGMALGITHHAVVAEGFFRRSEAVRLVEEWHTLAFLEAVDLEQVKDFMGEPNAVLVDARSNREFRRRSIPGAVNLPVPLAEASRGELFKSLDRNAVIVVYCGGPQCGYARRVAQILRGEGFRRVYWYKGGIAEWTEQESTS